MLLISGLESMTEAMFLKSCSWQPLREVSYGSGPPEGWVSPLAAEPADCDLSAEEPCLPV